MFITSSPAPSSRHLHIESRWLSATTVRIAVVGEIDLATTAELQVNLLDAISTPPPHCVDVDLAGVPFMDCGGLSVLIFARDTAARARCGLRVTRPQPLVQRVLEMTGLLDTLTSYPAGQNLLPGRDPDQCRGRPAALDGVTAG